MPLVTAERKYKFEVAFSFLHQDEGLANKLNDLIRDRLSTFIYSEHQKGIVGKDGVETYTKVFLEEARIVVILYRENWGTTPFTRIEENAIKQRGFEEGLDFTIFISLDKMKPQWVSRFQIWYDFDRYGIKSAAAIIEQRVAEYGGQIREESIADQSARHKREIERQKKMEKYLTSQEALSDAQSEVKSLLKIAQDNIANISDNALGISFGTSMKPDEYFSTFAQQFGLTFHWRQHYRNSLTDSYLEVYFADKDFYDRNPNRSGKILRKIEYEFVLNESDSKGWVNKADENDFKTSDQLVTLWQREFLERARKERQRTK